MKIAFIFGKGIDGCGVTRGALIYEKWLRDAGHDTLVVNFETDQLFGRAKDADFIGDILLVSKKDSDVQSDVIDAVNACDIAIFHSHPTRKQSNFLERYRRFVEKIDQPIVVMHDHGIVRGNINAIPQACEIFAHADMAVVQSLNGYSMEAYTNFDPGLKDNLIENPVWVKPSQYDSWRKPFEERRKHLLYIGRMSTLKDPALICRIEPYLAPEWDLSIIGCERSISSISAFEPLDINPAPYVPEFIGKINQWGMNKAGVYNLSDSQKNKNGTINSYDRYKYSWGMEQVGEAFASWCGYRLTETAEYGNRMEYTMIESYMLTLPIISKHFAENAYSPEGKLWGEYGNALVLQPREELALSEELKRLRSNKNEWEERTAESRRLITKFNNIDIIGQSFLDRVVAKGKRKNKVNPIEVISEYFPSAKERRARGEIIMSSPNGTLKQIPMIMEDGRQQIINEKPAPKATLEDFFG